MPVPLLRLLALTTLCVSLLAPVLRGADPPRSGDELLRLVPPRTHLVLSIDDLRGRARELRDSRLIAELRKLPPVRAWFDSDKYRELEAARDQIEDVFETSLEEIRDRILGDAVLLALELPPDAFPDAARARGLLMLKAGDPALLRKLLDRLNTIQKTQGEIHAVEDRVYRDQVYFVRRFPPGSARPDDVYVLFADGTFAICQSGESIRQVIDAKLGKAGTPEADRAASRFQSVWQRLPEQALARLLIETRMVSRLLENTPVPRSSGQALLASYLSRLEAAGAALVVRDGQVGLEVVELLDPGQRGSDRLKKAGAAPLAALERLPGAVLAAGSLQVDFLGLYQTLIRFVPGDDQPRLESLELVLKGILLGQDLRSRVLPGLGPRVTAFVEAPGEWKPGSSPGEKLPVPVILMVDLNDPPGDSGVSIAAALDNALSTLLAVISLDERHRSVVHRVVSKELRGVRIRSLEPAIPFAFAVDTAGHRLFLADSPASIERFLSVAGGRESSDRWRTLAQRAFPDAQSFLCLDLGAVHAMIRDQRDRIVEDLASREKRSRDDVARDLESVAALVRLFDAAFWAHRADPSSSTSRHSIGLLARPSDIPGASSPR